MKKHKKLTLAIAVSFLVLLTALALLFVFYKPLSQATAPISKERGSNIQVMRGLCPGTNIYSGEYPTYPTSRDFHIIKGEKDDYDQAVSDASDAKFSYYYNCWAYPVYYRLFL